MSEMVVFFSRPGNNYVSGSIKNLPVGNTEVVAGIIHKLTGAKLFKLEPVKAYSSDYHKCTDEALKEQRENARPEAKSYPDLSGVDVIYLGYPNWWGTVPMCVFTFLEKFDFAGKTIKPFCTHEGSGLGHSEADIKKVCPGANVAKGLAIHGGDASESAIKSWLGKNS